MYVEFLIIWSHLSFNICIYVVSVFLNPAAGERFPRMTVNCSTCFSLKKKYKKVYAIVWDRFQLHCILSHQLLLNNLYYYNIWLINLWLYHSLISINLEVKEGSWPWMSIKHFFAFLHCIKLAEEFRNATIGFHYSCRPIQYSVSQISLLWLQNNWSSLDHT